MVTLEFHDPSGALEVSVPFAKRLEPAQLAALGLAAATVGDDAFLLTGAIDEEEPRWLIPFSRGPVYQDLKVVAGTTLDLGRLRLECAFFRWRMHGRSGLGRYDVLRRAD